MVFFQDRKDCRVGGKDASFVKLDQVSCRVKNSVVKNIEYFWSRLQSSLALSLYAILFSLEPELDTAQPQGFLLLWLKLGYMPKICFFNYLKVTQKYLKVTLLLRFGPNHDFELTLKARTKVNNYFWFLQTFQF